MSPSTVLMVVVKVDAAQQLRTQGLNIGSTQSQLEGIVDERCRSKLPKMHAPELERLQMLDSRSDL
jgi:hypothetical protein